MKTTNLVLGTTAILLALAAGVGCSSSREVEITGEAKAAAQVDGPITLKFFEVPEEGEDLGEAISSVEIAKLGEFTQKVEVEGDKVRILALADKDKDGACSANESWAQLDAAIKDDDTVDRVTLALAASACPAAPSTK